MNPRNISLLNAYISIIFSMLFSITLPSHVQWIRELEYWFIVWFNNKCHWNAHLHVFVIFKLFLCYYTDIWILAFQKNALTLWMLGFVRAFFSFVDILHKINNFKTFLEYYHHSVEVWIQMRPAIMSGLVWVQTVCKSYQQKAKVATSSWRMKHHIIKLLGHCKGNTSRMRN